MILLRRIYSIYGALVFGLLFLILFPFFLIIIPRPNWHKYTHQLNYIWARAFLLLIFIPVRIEYRTRIDKTKLYILCSNHFSHLDIPVMGISKVYFVFTGKKSLAELPVFGYMFRNLHITVDRSNLKGRYAAFKAYEDAISAGKSISIFPEGGINSKNPPKMARFKDGPFKIAIEKQIPVIPVTIPYNWIILPDDDKFLLRWHPCKVIYHEPIETKGLSIEDLDSLKEQIFQIIDAELKRQNQ